MPYLISLLWLEFALSYFLMHWVLGFLYLLDFQHLTLESLALNYIEQKHFQEAFSCLWHSSYIVAEIADVFCISSANHHTLILNL